MRSIHKVRLAVIAALGAVSMVAMTGVPAHAYATANSPGWYGYVPVGGAQCGSRYTLAVGSDRQPMQAAICIAQTGSNSVQGYVAFYNYSQSSATAVATTQIWANDSNDNVHKGSSYTCRGKTLPAHGSLYCASVDTRYNGYGGLVASLMGSPTVNGYGGGNNSPWVSLTS